MILTTTNQNEKVSNEAVWQKNVFFLLMKNLTLISAKKFFQETPLYTPMKAGCILTVKGGELAI